MSPRPLAVALAGLLAACTAPGAPAPAPAPTPAAAPEAAAPARPGRLWEIERAPCSQLLALDDDDRSHAAMFYYGWLAARAGIRVIDAGQVERRIAAAMDACAAQPALPIAQAFRRALVAARARS